MPAYLETLAAPWGSHPPFTVPEVPWIFVWPRDQNDLAPYGATAPELAAGIEPAWAPLPREGLTLRLSQRRLG